MPALERDVGETRGATVLPTLSQIIRLAGQKFRPLRKNSIVLSKKTFFSLVFSKRLICSIISVSKYVKSPVFQCIHRRNGKAARLFQNSAFTGKIKPQFDRGFFRTLTFLLGLF